MQWRPDNPRRWANPAELPAQIPTKFKLAVNVKMVKVLGFEVASVDPDVVGINFVQPEDAYLAMNEYSRQMHMLDYLHTVYPKVHLSLHAGELAPGMVPPD